MKLSARISWTITAVTAFILGLSFAVVLWSVRRDETFDLDRMLLERAMSVRDGLIDSPNWAVAESHVVVPEEFRLLPHYAAVYDEKGSLISATESFGVEAPNLVDGEESVHARAEEPEAFDLRLGRHMLRAVVLPIGGSGHVLVYAVSRHAVDHDMRFLYRTLSILFFVAILLCWFATQPLGQRIARDIQHISGVAHQVASGRLEARVGPLVQSSVETKQLASDLDNMITQLEVLMSSQRAFLSHAAHELRSPLATLRGELQLALRRPRDIDGYRVTLQTLEGEVEELIQLTEDLLSLARFEAEALDVQNSTTVDAVVQAALRMSAGLIQVRGTRFEIRGDSVGDALALLVRGPVPELARALRNLIDNAIALSPEGGTVTLSIEPREDLVRIIVDDTGPGVAAEDAPHVFTPFYRGARRRGTSGAGLGLSIARRIARAARGEVQYEPRPGPGARFVLQLSR